MEPKQTELATLAGGCFWGVQGVYQHVRGVTKAVSGYAGGQKATAEYHAVGTGATGHAESVEIVFDPRVVSYGQILQVYFSVATDPTKLNRQGPDHGTQYRGNIFYAGAAQERLRIIGQLRMDNRVCCRNNVRQGMMIRQNDRHAQ